MLDKCPTDKPNSDRMFNRKEFEQLEAEFGPFDVDCCADPNGYNAQCKYWHHVHDSVLANDLSGLNVWANPPWHMIESLLLHYRLCKAKDPHNTSGCFVLPKWAVAKVAHLLEGMQQVREYGAGYFLFSAPHPTHPWRPRHSLPGIPWPVCVFRDEPQTARSVNFVEQLTPSLPSRGRDYGPLNVQADNSFVVSGTIKGMPARILVDTGAETNVVDMRFLRANKFSYGQQVGFVQGSFHRQPLPTFQFEGKVQFAGKVQFSSIDFEASQLNIVGVDAIIGLPWMKQNNVVLDTATSTMWFGSHPITGAPPVLKQVSAKQFQKIVKCTKVCFAISAVASDVTESEQHKIATSVGETCVPFEHAAVVKDVIEDYASIFPDDVPDGAPMHRTIQHQIVLVPNATPVAKSQYRLSRLEVEEVRKQVDYLVAKGFIVPSSSPWAAPVLFAPKPDGSLRFCIDYRALNKSTVKDKFPLPRSYDLLDKVASAKIFTKIDLRSGYWEIPMATESRQYTAFTTRYGLFEWTVMPFGLTNAPATFSRLMATLLRPYLDRFVVVYLDDICIFSNTVDEHIQHVRMVLEILKREGLCAKLSKCSFFQPTIEYLGHTIGNGKLTADTKKLGQVHDWPEPHTVQELQSFLGFANYFRKYIRLFSEIAAPLYKLTQGGKGNTSITHKWDAECTTAFQTLKDSLLSPAVLTAPDYSKMFYIFTDASINATGAILAQEDEDGSMRPVSFFSRKLTSAEVNYPTWEQELLAVVEALKEWHCFLEGSPFTAIVRTDHKPLELFMQQKTLSRRQVRWWELMHAYDFRIEYIKGIHNPADALSRNPLHYRGVALTGCVFSHLAPVKVASVPFLDEIVKHTAVDPWFVSRAASRMKLTEDGGVFYTRAGQIVVPSSVDLKHTILQEAHDSKLAGHRGVKATLKSLAMTFWWPNMHDDVNDVLKFVSSCLHCQRNKSDTKGHKPSPMPLPVPSSPFQSITMDFVTDLPLSNGFDAIMVIVDRFTKLVIAIPCNKTIDAVAAAKLFLHHVLLRGYGLPRNLISDRDPRFMSVFWQELMRLLGTKHKPSTAFHPQTDGQTEIYNRIIQEVLRNYVSSLQTDWSELLPFATFAINNTPHSIIKETPFFVLHGFHPRTPLTWVKPEPTKVPSLTEWFEKQKLCIQKTKDFLLAAYNKFLHKTAVTKFIPFKVGEMVLLSTKNLKFKYGTKKLHPRFCGPFKVTRVIRDVAFELDLPAEMGKVHNVFHGSLLKHFVQHDRHPLPPPPLLFDDDEFFEVDYVLKHRPVRKQGKKVTSNKRQRVKRNGRTKFELLVAWKGYGPEYNSWVKEEDCTDVLLDEYWQSIGGKPT